ncbi:glycosyltransferase family 4 protein [Haloarcula litorea]|uniref:glycosyltransferase family 4 protein n=1 Tax=Haloarcula litorea TaxID=3032579 RepID=UPI0023E7633D|nr:glycosyltransferase family 4 protein [Halomicroarcula sp. GDY20]
MADIGVVHASITAGGGAEAVGVHTVAALIEAGHDVTLYTTDAPDFSALNERLGTTVPGTVDIVTVDGATVAAVELARRAARPLGVTDFPLLRQTVFERIVADRYQSAHDTLVCTHGEFSIGDTVEYVHFPYFSPAAMRQYGTRFEESLYPPYHRLCRALKRRDSGGTRTTLTNSTWTATVIAETLGRDARVLHPPVDTDAFDPPEWEAMESGFVSVGRIHPLKRQQLAIDIVDALRASGVDTHVHIVGPVGDESYHADLADRASTRPYVHLEGELPRSDLTALLESHRYGLHTRRYEHFGMAVAEMVASGSLPFVHASGGQQAVVGNIDELCYSDRADAVEKIGTTLRTPQSHQRLLEELSQRAQFNSRAQFREEVVAAVEAHLTSE